MLSPKKQQLYQVHVETRSGNVLRVGPKAPREILEPFVMAINKSISLGKERDWSNPVLVETDAVL